MNRLVAVKGSKADFELACLAVSATNGCQVCLQSHEKVVLEAGLTEDQVHDAVRVAATVNGAAPVGNAGPSCRAGKGRRDTPSVVALIQALDANARIWSGSKRSIAPIRMHGTRPASEAL